MDHCSLSPRLNGRQRRHADPRCLASLALLSVAIPGCSAATSAPSQEPSALLSGQVGVGVLPPAHLAPAARLAHRFAYAYARIAYRRDPPRLPGATASVERRVALAASRVPSGRRRLRPHAANVEVELRGPTTLLGAIEIADGASPHFSVGFVVKRRHHVWRVIAISPPS